MLWLVRVRRSLLLLGWHPLSVDSLNVLQNLFESQLLLRVSSRNRLSRQNLVQLIWRQVLVHHLRMVVVVAKHSRPLSPSWSLLWLLLTGMLVRIQVLELVFAR